MIVRALFALMVLAASVRAGRLAKAGLPEDAAGIRAALQALIPGSEARAELDRRVVELGAETFAERAAAFQALRAAPVLPSGLFAAPANSDDPEVRYWARGLARTAEGTAAFNVNLLFDEIRTRPVPGLSLDLLRVAVANRELRSSALRAAVASLRPEDEVWLAAILETGQGPVAFALDCAARLTTPGLREGAARYLEDDDPDLRLAAARALLQSRDKRAVPVLLALLECDDPNTRAEACGQLRGCSGLDAACEEVGVWRRWATEDLAAAALKIPPLRTEAALHHRLLVAIWDSDEVLEYDALGKVTWRLKLASATGSTGLPNGHRLVVGHRNEVAEYGADGELLREFETKGDEPVFAQRLPNGDTVIGFERSVETHGPDGGIRSELALPERAWFCTRRLADGHTLVTYISRTGVVELDADGKEVAAFDSGVRCRDARRIPGGHLLVCEFRGRVVEFDRRGKIVWKTREDLDPVRAERLPNGHTRVIARDGLLEISPGGEERWLLKLEFHKTPNCGSYY